MGDPKRDAVPWTTAMGGGGRGGMAGWVTLTDEMAVVWYGVVWCGGARAWARVASDGGVEHSARCAGPVARRTGRWIFVAVGSWEPRP